VRITFGVVILFVFGLSNTSGAEQAVQSDSPANSETPVCNRPLVSDRFDSAQQALDMLCGDVCALAQTFAEWRNCLPDCGFMVHVFSSDPKCRVEDLPRTVNMREIEHEWEQIWQTNQPSHLTPERVHGGIQ
jgi:hypothetical protein